MIYCLVPSDLGDLLHDALRDRFRDDREVEVVVEFRRRDRRKLTDRRSHASAAAAERRRVRNLAGRRVEERRAAAMSVAAPALPAVAAPYADRLQFVSRAEPPSQHLEDVDTERLVIAYQAGDTTQFPVLYQRYFDRVYTYMLLVLDDDPHSAEDATDKVFAQVLAQLPRHQLRRAPFRIWLFACARNVAVRELLRLPAAESRRRFAADGGASFSPMPAWISDRQLQGLIGQLSRPHRQVLFLLYGAGLKTSQVAAVLERSPDTIRRQQARALRALRDGLIAIGRDPLDSTRIDAQLRGDRPDASSNGMRSVGARH
jgi:RNA polymerase sigma-70 factor, ECF subfamily